MDEGLQPNANACTLVLPSYYVYPAIDAAGYPADIPNILQAVEPTLEHRSLYSLMYPFQGMYLALFSIPLNNIHGCIYLSFNCPKFRDVGV